MIIYVVLVAVCNCAPELDNGLIQEDGLEIHNSVFPVTISFADDISNEEVQDAISWWQEQLENRYSDYCEYFDEFECFQLPEVARIVHDEYGTIHILKAELGMEYGGFAHLIWDDSG